MTNDEKRGMHIMNNESLKHYGVKGMKWGVRKDRGQVSTRISSIKRERDWMKKVKNSDKLSNDEMVKMTNRIRMENDLKRLSRTKGVGGKTDKQTYLKRANVSDVELSTVVNRLRAKDNLNRVSKDASKKQVAIGKRVVKTAATIGLKYAITGNIDTKDIGKAILNPNGNIKGAVIDAVFDRTNKNIVSRKGR